MKLALEQAKYAADSGDIPVGCVIVRDNKVIATGQNRRERDKTSLGHAEIEAIHNACLFLNDWRLDDCDLYVTLEPCPMCAGAIMAARIKTLVYGAREENTGSCASIINLFEENYPHKPAIYGGVLAEEASQLMSEFFQKKREK